jgi:hypothetical protein
MMTMNYLLYCPDNGCVGQALSVRVLRQAEEIIDYFFPILMWAHFLGFLLNYIACTCCGSSWQHFVFCHENYLKKSGFHYFIVHA